MEQSPWAGLLRLYVLYFYMNVDTYIVQSRPEER
jgi:hypothetical protein